jgi:salicylate hydroxylase
MKGSEKSRPISIAGAGIAGLSAAIALKLEGQPVAVFEREAVLEAVGAGIQLGPNATRIMEGWNLDLLGSSVEPEAIELRNALSGALLNTIPLKRTARARYGAPYVTLLRADLQQALLTRAKELEIPVNLGSPITQAKEKSGAVHIESGSECFTAPILIGADGLHSSVRKLAGFDVKRASAQAVAWRALLPLQAIPARFRKVIVIWMAPGAHFVHYPVSGGSRINGVLAIDDITSEDRESAGAEALPYLLNRIAGWAELPRSMAASTPGWLHWRLSGLAQWSGGDGRIQLIGDAWHPMRPYLASGGVMAIEDAAALAVSLKAASGDMVEGLRRFRENRGPRVWRVVRASAQMGRIYHCPQPFDIARDLVIRSATGTTLLSRNDWLYGVTSWGPKH